MGRCRGTALALAAVVGVACGGGNGSPGDGGVPDTGRDAAPGDAEAPVDARPPQDAGSEDAGPVVCGSDADCSDGLFCTGAEVCDPEAAGADARGCLAGPGDPCMEAQTCDESAGRCVTDCTVASDADGDGSDSLDCGGDDCDDADPGRFPGNLEVCDDVGHDEDCDPTTYGTLDRDGDGFTSDLCCNVDGSGIERCGPDCNDSERAARPLATELCDGLDNDCDGTFDEGVLVAGFEDADRDLHGDPDKPLMACPGIAGFSALGDDCDDAAPGIYPTQNETCDGLDEDCDGVTDEGAGAVTWYIDADMDGFGDPYGSTLESCIRPAGHSLLPTDCDDDDPTRSPAAAELCNGRDDDCNGRPDFEIAPGDGEDDDRDGVPDEACAPPGTPGDCDDLDPRVAPGAPELVDGIDNDCDGVVDGACGTTAWYVDADGDGWGTEETTPVFSCDLQEGRATRAGDCDDADPERSPAERDLCNGVDDDCDGAIDENAASLCYLERALPLCVDGACAIGLCDRDYDDCDGADATGCEAALQSSPTDCGSCDTVCFAGPRGLPYCGAGTCALMCQAGYADCDDAVETGCETDILLDPANCGRCDAICSARDNADAACDGGSCALACHEGWADCDGVETNGCEVRIDRAVDNCGACGMVCPIAGDICVRGSCIMPAFPSDGSEGAFEPTANVRLSPGVHHFTTIRIPSGVTVTTTGSGVLDLRATEDVVIEGTIDVSGSRGGNAQNVGGDRGGSGGATGRPDSPGGTPPTCPAGAAGGQGAAGGDSQCAPGGRFGGGAGAYGDGGGLEGGGGGGGYAGGGAGVGAVAGAAGASFDSDRGGAGGVLGGPGGRGGEHGADPLYSGQGGATATCPGGGSIGRSAFEDLAVRSTFRPGSGGGGGGLATTFIDSGGGGGGAGGAVRIASATRVVLRGTILANGADGGNGYSCGGGGGSGGVIYLAAPEMTVSGNLSVVGGAGPAGPGLGKAGDGGLGRIRVSALPERCGLGGSFDPPLVSGCSETEPAVRGRTYVGVYPN